MRATIMLLPVFSLSALPVRAEDVDRTVVVVATEISGNWGEAPACPQNSICLDGPYEARFKTIKTVAGSGAPAEFNATVWLHVHPKGPVKRAFLLKHWPDKSWSILANSFDTCFRLDKVNEVQLTLKPTSRTGDGRVCFAGGRAN